MIVLRRRWLRALLLGALAAAGPAGAADPLSPEAEKDLAAALSRILQAAPLRDSRVGILVETLDGGQVLFARDPDELLNPASNVKLFTSAAALARLGPEYRFETEFYLDGPAAAPTLYARGKGDPSMVTERLWAVAGEIAALGPRSLAGIAVDDSFFDAEREGPGFDQEKGDRSYLAPAGALSLDFNAVAVHVSPGARPGDPARVALEPPSAFLGLESHLVTVGPRGRRHIALSSVSLPGRQRILVAGRIPAGGRSQVFYRKIDDPPLYFGYTLKRLLELRGLKVGRVRRAAVPEGARLLHVAESDSLAEVVRRLDKTSNNFMAEQVLKTLGAEAEGPPGTWPKGVRAVEDFLAEVGLPRGSFIMKNGSGLNDANRFSARQVVTLLRAMWRRFPLMAEFVGALPVAGKDGTIRWRMEGSDAVGRLRAKTGTLETVVGLSGFVESRGGQRLVFSMLVNDYPGKAAAVVRAVDAVGGALAAAGGPAVELGAAVAMAGPPAPAPAPGPTAPGDLRAHVASYYRLAAAGDRRNLPLLRAALRSERDPVLRLAAAEAAYLSDPDSDAARRTFLESAVVDAKSLATLRVLAAPFDVPLPVIGSLADLAAEGVPEALARLVEATFACAGDAAFATDLADVWAEVAAAAPAELLAALRSAPGPAAEATLDSLATGLARAKEDAAPLRAAVEKAASGPDADLAAFARALAPGLEARLRAAQATAAAAAPGAGATPTSPGGG